MDARPNDTKDQIRPLVTAGEMFPVFEDMVLRAEKELILTFRVLEADTRLVTDAARKVGRTWADLLSDAVDRGVHVHLMLSDFDPIYATDLHVSSWRSAEKFVAANDKISVQLARHGQELGPFWRGVFAPKSMKELRKIRKNPPRTMTPPLDLALAGKKSVYPVSHHQKLAVADGKAAIIGGLDVNDRRWDDRNHRQPAQQTWHDVSLYVRDGSVDAMHAHAVDTWNAALDDPQVARFGATPVKLGKTPPGDWRVGRAKLLRTVSRTCRGPMAFGPTNIHAEIEREHLRMIGDVERFLYVETQFFRHKPIARALCEAAKRHKALQMVMVLPMAPERVLWEGADGLDARHAHALQMDCVEMVRKAFGDRCAFISPAKPEPVHPDEGPGLEDAGVVYIHAKVMVADDRECIVGSANLNGRSMRWDTEAALLLKDADFSHDLRVDLSRHWLGPDPDTPDLQRATFWMENARANARRAPEDRPSFVLPYPVERGHRFSRRVPFLPDDMF